MTEDKQKENAPVPEPPDGDGSGKGVQILLQCTPNRVTMAFNKKVWWFALKPEAAEQLAQHLCQRADEARRGLAC